MILRSTNLKLNLADYGILIPIVRDRADRVFAELMQDENLKAAASQWLVEADVSAVSEADLYRVHNKDFVQDLFSDHPDDRIEAAYELYKENGEANRYQPEQASQSLKQLFQQVLLSAGGTVASMELALQRGFCFYLNSYAGAHHAMSFGGRGFCLINDIVIGLKRLQYEKKIKTAWVIDVDAHKGDGTAELLEKDASIRCLSIHMAKGWPLEGKQHDAANQRYPWFVPSDIDIPVEKGCEAEYLASLAAGLKSLEALAVEGGELLPDLVVVVNGSDPYEKDTLPSAGLLKLTKTQMLQRDQLVFDFLKRRSLPQVWLMAGGYGEQVYSIYLQFLHWFLTISK